LLARLVPLFICVNKLINCLAASQQQRQQPQPERTKINKQNICFNLQVRGGKETGYVFRGATGMGRDTILVVPSKAHPLWARFRFHLQIALD